MWNEYSSDLQTLVDLYYKYDLIIESEHLNRKKKNKTLKNIINDIKESDLNDEYFSLFSADQSYEEIVSILKKAVSSFEQLEQKRDEEFNEAAKDLSHALQNLLRPSSDTWLKIIKEDNDLLIQSCGSSSLDTIVRLTNAESTTTFSELTYCFWWYQLHKENNRYRYELWYCSPEDDHTESKFAEIIFDNAVLEFKNYSIMNNYFKKPWVYIGFISRELCDKHSTEESLLNDKEKELLPLAKFLSHFFFSFDEEDIEGTDEFLYIVKQKYPDDIDKIKRILNKRYPFDKLESLLNEAKYEPLWRDIYARFESSQQGRQIKLNSSFTESQRAMITETITDVMHHNGFLGEYPDFYKPAQFKGAVLYAQDSFWINEKNVTLHIKCIEEDEGLKFLCGGIAKKKNDNSDTDIYTCMFDDNGRRFIKAVECYDEERLLNMKYVSDLATVAVKRASLKKLDKNEKEFIGPRISVPLLICAYLFIFLFISVLGAVIFSIFFFLVISVFTFIFILFTKLTVNDYFDLLKEFPWAISALFGPLFALGMTLSEFFQNRK